MTMPSPLACSLSQQALDATDEPAEAVASLMSGAALILQRSFGPRIAADMILNMVIEARLAMQAPAGSAEPTRA